MLSRWGKATVVLWAVVLFVVVTAAGVFLASRLSASSGDHRGPTRGAPVSGPVSSLPKK